MVWWLPIYDVQWLIWYKLWFSDFTDWSIYCVRFTLEGEREWNDRYIYIYIYAVAIPFGQISGILKRAPILWDANPTNKRVHACVCECVCVCVFFFNLFIKIIIIIIIIFLLFFRDFFANSAFCYYWFNCHITFVSLFDKFV